MKIPLPSKGVAIAIACSAMMLGSFAIIQLQNLPRSSNRQNKSEEELKAAASAEECIKNPGGADCESIDPKLLSIDTWSRLQSALVRHKAARTTNDSSTETTAISQAVLYSACKRYTGKIMGRDPSIMTSDYSAGGNMVGISYIRSSDQKLFKYECRSNGSEILWRGVDIFSPGEGPGRWREEDAESIASYL